MIPSTSRYAAQPVLTFISEDGTARAWSLPPLLPRAGAWQDVARHRVGDSDRLDLLAARAYADAGGWVLIAGAAPVADPAQVLAEPGREIAVPRAGARPDPLAPERLEPGK